MSDRSYQLEDLLKVVKILRDPEEGCAWDRVQTFKSLVPSTLEECYELAEAIEQRDYKHVREELGDILFQVVFYAQMASEAKYFEFADIVSVLVEKLMRRHPQVFSGGDIETRERLEKNIEAQTKGNWESIKKLERAERHQHGIFEDIPIQLPALTRAQKLQNRAAGVGFDSQDLSEVFFKIRAEVVELEAALQKGSVDDCAEELGDLLFSCVNAARHLEQDSESLLREVNRKFERRFTSVEKLLVLDGISLADATIKQMNTAWHKVKRAEKILT